MSNLAVDPALFDAGGAFSPADIAGLTLWLDSDDPATVTDAGSGDCSQWNDKSGNGFHVTQSTSGDRPAITASAVNGRTALSFDGVSDHLDRVTTQLVNVSDGSFTVFAVAVTDTVAAGTGQILCQDNTTGARRPQFLRRNGSAAESIVFAGSTAATDGAGITLSTATAYLFEAISDGATIECLVDGSGDGPTARASQNAVSDLVAVGVRAKNSSGSYWDGFICEIVFYDLDISTEDRASVRGYLSDRWGTA